MWYTISSIESSDLNTVRATLLVEESSPWYSGHFPDNPILPGIAQLHMVSELIALARQEKLCIKRLSRVKFKKIVRPGERLELNAKNDGKPYTYSFRITSEAQDVCSGTMSLAVKTVTAKIS